jgi:hypothetical protein
MVIFSLSRHTAVTRGQAHYAQDWQARLSAHIIA